MLVLFWDFLMFDQIFYSPQVKQSVVIIDKNGMYKLSRKLPNDLRLKIFGK